LPELALDQAKRKEHPTSVLELKGSAVGEAFAESRGAWRYRLER